MRRAAESWGSESIIGDWKAVLGSGLLLGCIISLMELTEQPMAGASLAAVWVFLSAKGGYWLGVGVVWSILAHAEPRLGTVALILLGFLASIAITGALLIPTAMSRLAWFGGSGSVLFGPAADVLPLDARAAHLLWTNCFYGGLYLAVFSAIRRAAESRRVLAGMQQARDESAMLLKKGQLESFRRQLQPGTITDAIAALKAIYRSNPSQADNLIDHLVGFLRPAVRSLQVEATTFAVELDLAVRYLRLRSAVTGEACTIVADPGPMPEAPFPPRLLVPVVERFCLAGHRVRLTMGWRDESYRVELEAGFLAECAISPRLREDMTLARARGTWRLTARLESLGEGIRWTILISPLTARAMPVVGG